MLEIEDLNVTFSLQWNQWSSNAATWNLKWRQRDSCEISLYVKDMMSTVDLYYKVFILKKFNICSAQLFFYLYLVTTGISFFDLMFCFFFLVFSMMGSFSTQRKSPDFFNKRTELKRHNVFSVCALHFVFPCTQAMYTFAGKWVSCKQASRAH